MANSNLGKNTDSVLNGKLRIEQGDNRMIVNDGTADILLIGEDPDGNIVVKLSQPGVDVKTASDNQLIFSSENNLFKIASSGTTSVAKGANSTFDQTSFLHGLSTIPIIVAFCDYGGGLFDGNATSRNSLPVLSIVSSSAAGATGMRAGGITAKASCRVDSTAVTFRVDTPNDGNSLASYTGAYTVNFKYYLLVETAN